MPPDSQFLSSLAGTLVSFDAGKIPFDQIFLEKINKVLARRSVRLSELGLLHELVHPSELAELYKECYAFMDEEVFLVVYRRFIRDVMRPCLKSSFFHQRKPGIRFHLPATNTVQYHTDEWYGHGHEVINCWLPLTPAFDSNSLHVASWEASVREVKQLEVEKATMGTINARLRGICKPLTAALGQVFLFNAQTAHGSETNATTRTRVSMDCRLLVQGGDAGTKVVAEYYENLDALEQTSSGPSRKEGSLGVTYIYAAHGFTQHLSHASQRLVCLEFARAHSLSIVAEETEIRTMSHHPTLLDLAEGKGTHANDSVVLFSLFCLPEDGRDRSRIYNAARANKTSLHFANERLTFPAIHSEDDLESKRLELEDRTQAN